MKKETNETEHYFVTCLDKREAALLRDWYVEWLFTFTRFVRVNTAKNEVFSPGMHVAFVTREQIDRNHVLQGIDSKYILPGLKFGQGLARRTNIEEIADRLIKDKYEQFLKGEK